MNQEILLCIAGLGGAIGTTVAAGLAAGSKYNSANLGLVTESPLVKGLGLDFPSLELISLEGWDTSRDSLLAQVRKHNVLSGELISMLEQEFKGFHPRPGIEDAMPISIWISQESEFLTNLARSRGSEQIVIVNLCPTESIYLQENDAKINWEDTKTITLGKPGVTVSRLYFRLAIEVGAHYIEFTPNSSITPALAHLAKSKGILYCGNDGKTGQTFLKTTIGPALRDRNLRIDGWFSTNILGNNDGLNLSNKEALATKRASKLECLEEILGYRPGSRDHEFCHQVQIHYYPPRGDSKEAWDNVDFTGFLGIKMQMKINWLGTDSILAAPLILDLARIVSLASSKGHKGLLEETAYFFKAPLAENEKVVEHSTPSQFSRLLLFLNSLKSKE